jgi:phosphomannomutase
MTPHGPTPVSLRAALDYAPVALKFGTSGRRGQVLHLTQFEIYLNARAELDYLLSLTAADGGIRPGQEFFIAHDLRPSSTRFVAEQGGRGEILQAVWRAVSDAGLRPVNLGAIPTPALTACALARRCGSIMITGSHIPFDRNGYKTNSAKGELLKRDEVPINALAEAWRTKLGSQPFAASLFAANGNFKNSVELGAASAAGREAFLRRYLDFFAGRQLKGLRLVAYQHSAVGRDLLVELLRAFGAEVIPAGRSETFVPIDTEAIDDSTLEQIRTLAQEASQSHDRVDAVVSTDGDSDRPLLVGIDYDPAGRCLARFFPGDLVGMVVAVYLGADAVVVPISCNDAIDRSPLCDCLEPKTRIGSPFVIAGMQDAVARGRRRVCGWEANGGFLTGSDFVIDGRVLPALPTRDAFLPILCTLFRMVEVRQSMSGVFAALPRRFSRAALLRNFPRATSLKILAAFTPTGAASGEPVPSVRESLQSFFTAELGFGDVARVDYTDGVRVNFTNGDVAHIRPSGNADEFRIYAVADSQARADEIARLGVSEPAGILRRMEQAFA